MDSSQAYRGKAAEMDVTEESNKTGVDVSKEEKMRQDVGHGDTVDVFFFLHVFSEVFESSSHAAYSCIEYSNMIWNTVEFQRISK